VTIITIVLMIKIKNIERSYQLAKDCYAELGVATLYRLHQWKNGRIENEFSGGKQISANENPSDIFSLAR
jgi:hypothetical protein